MLSMHQLLNAGISMLFKQKQKRANLSAAQKYKELGCRSWSSLSYSESDEGLALSLSKSAQRERCQGLRFQLLQAGCWVSAYVVMARKIVACACVCVYADWTDVLFINLINTKYYKSQLVSVCWRNRLIGLEFGNCQLKEKLCSNSTAANVFSGD